MTSSTNIIFSQLKLIGILEKLLESKNATSVKPKNEDELQA